MPIFHRYSCQHPITMSKSIVVILDNIRSHHNVGSVFRSADAFGIDEVILLGITPRPPHRDIQKTALGATESVSWRHFESHEEILHELKENGYRICSVEQDERSLLFEDAIVSDSSRIAVILGNEVKGVNQELLAESDEVWEIRQQGIKKSLNVSVCAGIVMHQLATAE